MELNKEELKIVLDLLVDKLEVINNRVEIMDSETFNSMIKEKDKLKGLYNKVFNALQPPVEIEEDSIFAEGL